MSAPSDSLEGMDQGIRQRSLAAMPTKIQLLDDVLLHINHGTTLLADTKHDRGLDFLSAILLGRSFNVPVARAR